MTEPMLETPTQRLDRLEREVRWWKAWAVCITFAGLGLLLLAARPGSVVDEVRAKRFVLVGQDGRERARLVAGLRIEDLDFPAMLQFLDKQGRMVSHVAVLAGRDGKERGQVTVNSEEEGRSVSMLPGLLSLIDDKGLAMLSSDQLSISSGSSEKGKKAAPTRASVSASAISVSGPNLTLARLGVEDDTAGSAVLWLKGRRAQHGVRLESGIDGSATLDVSGGKRLTSGISLEVAQNGSPTLIIRDNNGQSRAVMGEVELATDQTGRVEKLPASSLALFDKDGKVIWKAP